MTVLVTGGAGYIGSHTCVLLLEAGFDIVVVDNYSNSSPEALSRVSQIAGKTFPSYKLDVRDEAALSEVFDKHSIDCVIHFAGLKAVGESVQKPLMYYENNLNATLTLCRVMAEHQVKRIVFSSSATVYSPDNPLPYIETGIAGNCTNPYGWSKYFNEIILRSLASADPDWSVVLLRYFNPIGAHPSGLIGEDPAGIPNNLMPFITQTAVGRREHLSIYGADYDTPDGTGVRDYLHVLDLASGHIAAVKFALENKGTDVFNLGTGQGVSVLQMVNTFSAVNNVSIPYVVTDRRPGDIPAFWADPSKAERILGWKAQKALEDMCRDSFNWQKNNPNGYLKD